MKRLVLLVIVLVALLGLTSSTSFAAYRIIDTFDNNDSAWVTTQRATYGQPITAPAGMTQLNRFVFKMEIPATTTFRGYVYAWDGSKATDLLYESGDRNTSGTPQTASFETGSIPVTPGAKYVIFVSTSKNSGAALNKLMINPGESESGDAYPGSTWVSLDNGTNVNAWTTSNWLVPTYGGDLAFTAYFTDAVGATCYGVSTGANPASGGIARAITSPNCPTDSTKYIQGTGVDIMAFPNEGYSFTGWSGDASGTNNPTGILMNSDKSVTASFSNQCYTLTLTHTGSGADPIASPTNSPSCPTGAYLPGVAISLTASPASGWEVSGWTGTDYDNNASTASWLHMPEANHTASAAYRASCTTSLATTANPWVGGYVRTDPISRCGGSSFDPPKYGLGAVVTLTAYPYPGYTFSSWSGDETGSANPITVTLTSDKSVTANFSAIPCYTLASASDPMSGGSVGASPGPNCVTAAGKYTQGTVVTLSPTANTGYTFSGWSGDVTGTTNPTTVTMSTDKSVTASFTGAPELAITDFTPVQTRPGSRSFNLNWTITNQGPLTAPGIWKDTVYLSADGTLDLGDTVLKKSVRQRESLAAAGNYSEKMRVNLPRGDSRRYLILRTDDENTVVESDESNNTHVYQITVPVMADAPDEADADLP